MMESSSARPRAVGTPHGGRRSKALTVALGVLTAAAVPFVVTGLFRLTDSVPVVGLVCLGIAWGLTRVPHRGRPLAWTWFAGCVLWAAFFTWLLWQFSPGLKNFD